MIDFQFLFSAISLLMTIAMLTPSSEASQQVYQRCFPASGYCLNYHIDLVSPPKTTDEADALCQSNGGKLLELPDEGRRQDFRNFAAELSSLDFGTPKKSKFFINLRRIPRRNRWMWLQSGTIPSLLPAEILPTGLSTATYNSDACAIVRKTGPNGIEFGAAPCYEKKGYICKIYPAANCWHEPCYQAFFENNWISISSLCNLASVLDLVVSSQTRDPIQVLQEFEKKILASVENHTEELWIGLTKYYWTWTSTGAMVDKNLLPWNWGASDGKGADECLIKIVPNLTIDYPTGGIAWGVVCMEEYNPNQPATTNLVVVKESPSPLSSSSSSPPSSSSSSTETALSASSSTTATTTTSSSSSSSSTTSSLPSSLLSSSSSSSSSSTSVLLLPLPVTTLTPQLLTTTFTGATATTKYGNSNLDGNSVTIALVLGITLGVLITFAIAVLIFKVKRKKDKLKEREANEEFHFSTEMPKNEDQAKEVGETIVLDSRPDILWDGTASFSTRILKSITSGDKIPARPVTPTAISLDAPTMFKNYENFPDFNSSFT